jgi:uncharacterized protein (DUF1778 family)
MEVATPKIRLTARVTAEQHARFTLAARLRGQTLASFIRDMLEEAAGEVEDRHRSGRTPSGIAPRNSPNPHGEAFEER